MDLGRDVKPPRTCPVLRSTWRPELFENRPPTVASDIYSLGVLLFYLLAGRLPVEGPSLAELKEAHAKRVRTRLRDLRPELPDAVVQVVERAAAHDASERYQTAGELEHALVGTLGSHAALPSSTDGADATGRATAARGRRSGGWVTWTSVAIAALAVLALALDGSFSPTAEGDPMLVRFPITLPENTASWPRLSPDGRKVVYGTIFEGRDVLWVREVGTAEGRPIPHTSARETAFWSADSRTLAFFEEGKLKKVAATGDGEPLTIADAPHPKGGDWNQDGVLLFATNAGLFRVNADGTGLGAVTRPDESRGEVLARLAGVFPGWAPVSFCRPKLEAGTLRALPGDARRICPQADHAGLLASGLLVRVSAVRA